MSTGVQEQTLLDPISAEQPCGENLEDTPTLAALEGTRLFGQSRSPEAPPDPEDVLRGGKGRLGVDDPRLLP